MTKYTASLDQLEQAFQRLRDALASTENDLQRDASIQRFEFTLDLSWKVIKSYLEEKKGVIVTSPKDAFRQAFKHGLIDYDEIWLEFVDLRNQTVHTYDLEKAKKTYAQLSQFAAYIKLLINQFHNSPA